MKSSSLTRPANTTAYTIGDAVADLGGTPLVFNFAGETGRIHGGRLTKNTVTTANANFRLWLFVASPAAAPVDNAAFAVAFADRGKRIGYIDFTTAVAGSDCTQSEGALSQTQPLPFALPAGEANYGVLVASAAYVPASGEVMQVDLQIAA